MHTAQLKLCYVCPLYFGFLARCPALSIEVLLCFEGLLPLGALSFFELMGPTFAKSTLTSVKETLRVRTHSRATAERVRPLGAQGLVSYSLGLPLGRNYEGGFT